MASSAPIPAYPSSELIECPYPYFDRMRSEAPVHLSGEQYLVFRHADITRILRDEATFGVDLGPTPFDRGDETMISSRTGEEHRAARDFAYRAITPRRLREFEPHLAELVDRLIAGFAQAGTINFMTEFALPIPGLVMCELMGLATEGEEGRLILGHWGDLVASGDGTAEGVRSPFTALLDFFDGKLRERFVQPGDDMLSDYLRAQIARDGEPNFDFLTVVATEMLVGGAGTTALMMTNALWLLLSHPAQLERLRRDPALIPRMLDETLRTESVVQERKRVVLEQTEISGVTLPVGARLTLVLASANRDPDVFEDPDRFDVCRAPERLKRQIGFGLGAHTCIGAPLARLEGKVAFERLLARTKNLKLSERNDFEHVYSTHFRSFKELWVDFDPVEEEEPHA